MPEQTVNYHPIKYIFYSIIYIILFVILFNQNLEIIGFVVSFFVNTVLSILMAFDLNNYFVASLARSNNSNISIQNTEFINQVYLIIIYIGLLFNIIASLFMFLTITSIQSSFATVSMPVEFTPKNRNNIETYKKLFALNILFIFAIIFSTIIINIGNYTSKNDSTIFKKLYDILKPLLNNFTFITPLFGAATLAISGYLVYITNDLTSMKINNLPPPPEQIRTAMGIQTATIPLSNKSWNLSLTDFVKKYMNSYYLSNYVPFY